MEIVARLVCWSRSSSSDEEAFSAFRCLREESQVRIFGAHLSIDACTREIVAYVHTFLFFFFLFFGTAIVYQPFSLPLLALRS